jgi:enoyl-CoA hydratase/carnithine racemase
MSGQETMAQGRKLPKSLKVERKGAVAILTLARPEKRNALNDTTVLGLEAFFASLPAGVKAVVLNAQGKHFSAGLDLSELKVLSTEDGIAHSRMWHGIFDKIEFGRVPVVTVMHGAVVGGGLELAAATHIRIAESASRA